MFHQHQRVRLSPRPALDNPGNAGGTQDQAAALLAWSQPFTNFDNVSASERWTGWTNDTVAVPCAWTGVICSDQHLHFDLAYQHLQGEAQSL